MIYFVEIHTVDFVHVPALGLTNYFIKYAVAINEEGAKKKICKFLEDKKINWKKIECRPSLSQNQSDYTFPENIL